MTKQRSFCVITGSRADYGLLYWLLKEIAADPDLRLRLIVTGAHLSTRYGETVREIERDGFAIDARIPILDDGDSRLATVVSMGRALSGIAEALEAMSPDFVIVLGDRYEMLAAAEAAFVLGIPLAHIHGGEITEGALDDGFRHAITKLADIHFVAAEAYRRRVIQMGENPDRVIVVGGLGVEYVRRMDTLSVADLDHILGLPLRDPLFLVTYHPVTKNIESDGIGALIAALETFRSARVVITGVNADPGNQVIRSTLEKFASEHPDRVSLHASLGIRAYLNVMRRAAAVIGNSSSGIIEAPALGVPTIDIGLRQSGRIKAASVIRCPAATPDIVTALRMAMTPSFLADAQSQVCPYGDGRASERITATLKSLPSDLIVPKQFYDLAVS
jgi:UDP-hydrolysing UDP-N-acetyl-D-glucosamine 2-epimerase